MKKRLTRSAAVVSAGLVVFALGGCSTVDGGASEESAFGGGTLDYVVPYGPGGSSDPVGREFARLLAIELGANDVVTNMPGGDTTIGVAQVINSTPDGHTLGLSSTGGIVIQPLTNPDLSYGTDDFEILAKMTEAPNAIFVGGDSPYETLDDLLADAKQRPGEVRVGGPGTYISTGFVAAALEDQADVEFTMVPFSGGAGEAVLGAMANEVEAVVVTAAAQLGLVESGDLRPLAYTGSEVYGEKLPGAVSLEAEGYDIPFPSEYMTFMPVGIPDDVRTELKDASAKVMFSDGWAEWCSSKGYIATPMEDAEVEEWYSSVVKSTENVINLLDTRQQG